MEAMSETVETGGKQGIPLAEGAEPTQGAEQGAGAGQEAQQEQGQVQGQGEGAISGKKLGGKFSPEKQYIPYERFQQAQTQFQGQLSELQQALAQLQKGRETATGDDPNKERSEKFWKDPHAYVDENLKNIQGQIYKQFQEEVGKQLVLRDLRGSQGYSQELEDQMVSVIQANNLRTLGPVQAVKVAYKLTTGRDFGSAPAGAGGQDAQSGYSTRMTKERLSRPSSASGAGAEGPGMDLASFNNMSLAEFSKDPQGYINKLMVSQGAGQ